MNGRIGIGFSEGNRAIYNKATFLRLRERDDSEMGREINEFRVELVNKYVPPERRVLDIGPGALTFMKARGNCLAFDINPHAVAILKRKNEWFDAYSDSFSVKGIAGVTFFDSLEHITNPAIILNRIGGQHIIISLPIFWNRKQCMNSKHFKPGEHLWYFTHRSFLRYMTGLGFEMLEERNDETRMGRESIKTFVFQRI
ncbi:MAG: class I SAM-dependent methyltransferase [Candidatus Aminicenantes bacterium]|nr:class I SAM-dependent methyltransferase [Candidatus Aminicenantes bacterium]